MPFEALLSNAPMDYIRRRLGKELCGLLDLIEGGTASDERLRAVAAIAIDAELLVADEDERATLIGLVPAPKQGELAQRLGSLGDGQPLEYLHSLKWTPDERRELLEFFGFEVERTQPQLPSLKRETAPDYALFPHQLRAARRTKELLYDGPRRAVLHLPTGVGKTRTGMSMICDHLRQHGPALVVWLAHGQELLEQAATEFERAWSKVGDRPLPVLRVWGSASPDLADVTDGLVVLGLEKAVSIAKSDPQFLRTLAARSTLTVFDEAHQIIAPTFQGVVDDLTVRHDSSLLGLTATPGRTWADIAKDEELADFFSRQKVMLEIEGYTNPVTALIDQGYLAKPIMRTVAAEAGMHLSARDQQSLARAFEIPDSFIAELAKDKQWNLKVVQTIMELLEKQHRRILVFAASVQHCRLIASVLSAAGFDAVFVTGESSPRHRSDAIRRFKSAARRPMILCNFGVLTTGFDAPAASAAVIARPTKSLVLYSQMVGRVIRGPKAGGTETCEIVTVVDPELPGFGDVAEAFTNWEDVWETA
ncbi:DEAD/DEAH box helicase [Streptomyces sp. WAC05374]|uniref:DEAD/DEAH box helicase n=1 Tax=Streptomyces sp. WAC05374 TaxID=2487420 RepID=UPI000F8625E3|nr:DEAD/DEAH box helicase family protein [Streptomyces sp. WAC05374]RST18879.1 DEAD/DEAH box helicase [Streptomyces sp. WAC05374]TDF43866.1 DEAD/DEAH box helicase [Streptomyces sp. WAC05374]TDF51967.1 DEAD/DEAH box helicase [Streptomyces sp. WAC05374]TDF54322.1 DEAD/DEAH box helicase [Streptomyces sp. WAC05374]